MINNIIKKLPLTSDIVFKRVFSREGNEDILKALLEAILEIPIQDVTVKNPELPRNLYESKAGVLDVKVEIDKDKICDIEMQVKDLKNIDKRSTYYMSKILSDELKKSEDYIAVKNTIVINLLNFGFYKRNSYHSIAHMKFEKTKENEYIDMGYQNEDEIATKELEMHFIEIPKFIKKNPKATTKLEQWLWLIAGREEKLEMAKEENKEIKKAMDIIDEMSMDEKEWELYESRKMAIMDYNTGIIEAKEEGIIKGQKQKQIEIAKELLKMNMNIDNIQKVTKLTKEEIEKLKS
jgi:predicted transposase/invertase (TIGR01784 family)